MDEKNKNEKPIAKIFLNGVSASIWENSNKEGDKYLTLTFQRSYKDKSEKWQNSNSFRIIDLPNLIAACNKALNQYWDNP